jgi:hypothetical protein
LHVVYNSHGHPVSQGTAIITLALRVLYTRYVLLQYFLGVLLRVCRCGSVLRTSTCSEYFPLYYLHLTNSPDIAERTSVLGTSIQTESTGSMLKLSWLRLGKFASSY